MVYKSFFIMRSIMPFSLSMDLHQKPVQSIKQMQRLIMSREMQQAIHLLQVPVMELAPIIELELEQNPVLESLQQDEDDQECDADMQQLADEVEEEATDIDTPAGTEVSFDERDFEIMRRLDEDFRDHFSESEASAVRRSSEQERLQTFLESSICAEPTLFEHLMAQAHEALPEEKDRVLAEALIGNLDENGFLTISLQEIAMLQNCSVAELERVLEVIQTFDPCGIGAKNLQGSLLIQLCSQGKQDTLAYAIIDKHFNDLLHNHVPAIKRGLHCTAVQIAKAIDQHIIQLDLHPGRQLFHQTTSYITPDLTLQQDGENLVVVVSEESMPHLRLNRRYLQMLDDESLTAETKAFIQQKVVSAKWLLRNIMQRNDTLSKIGESLARSQCEFFLNPQGKLVPLTMKIVADELQLHESTIARAVANKYIDTPRGLFSLRFFFTNALVNGEGEEISAKTARDMLSEVIENEDKSHPLSDEAIAALMKDKGIKCARRTIAKYRLALNIGTAQQRRKF